VRSCGRRRQGIETEDAALKALGLGCDKGQGYFFGKPVMADDLDLADCRLVR
jgi:EAL domain-containing protein (putative c-di-GMP-specific phosphodiesterase class I)